jgi:DNA (cytosine-5)-methyltransferase 1
MIESGNIKDLSIFHDYDFKKYKGKQRMNKIARNLVDFEVGKTILETAFGIERKQNVNQVSIFDTVE